MQEPNGDAGGDDVISIDFSGSAASEGRVDRFAADGQLRPRRYSFSDVQEFQTQKSKPHPLWTSLILTPIGTTL
jgi:hypothetical protein